MEAFGFVCGEWTCPCVHEIVSQTHFMPCVRSDLSSSVGMHTSLCAGLLCSHNCCVSFGPADVYCDQTCLRLGRYFKCVFTEIGSRLLFCAVQTIDMLIGED